MFNQRILHLIHGLAVGGAEVDLVNKSAALVQHYNYDITICCLMRRGELASQAEASGIRVIGPIMRHRYDILAGLQLRQILLAKPSWSLVHTHLFGANFIGCVVALTLLFGRRPRFLAAEHAMAERWGSNRRQPDATVEQFAADEKFITEREGRLALFLDRLLIQHCAARILVPSYAAAASYEACGIQKERLEVISNAIDVRRFKQVKRAAARIRVRQELNISSDAYLIGTVCSLRPVKGLPILLKALESLPVYLAVAGDGPQYSSLKSMIQSCGLDDRVKLLGVYFNIPQFLAALDLFVFPSYSESFGIAVAEALLMKIPVVATNVGGIPEVTSNGKYAYLVPPGDADALTEAIQWMIHNPKQAQIRARKGYKFVHNTMSIDVVAAKQHTIYQQILKQQRS